MKTDYAFDEYMVTALAPSEIACLAKSPNGNKPIIAWISRDVEVFLLLYWASLAPSVAMRWDRSTANEFMILMALGDLYINPSEERA